MYAYPHIMAPWKRGMVVFEDKKSAETTKFTYFGRPVGQRPHLTVAITLPRHEFIP